MSNSMVLFTLISPTALKDEITDKLLVFKGITGFNLLPIQGYSKQHSSFDLEAQVRGYNNLVRFEVLLPTKETQELKQMLARSFSSTRLKYWCVPIFEEGHL